MNKSKYVFPQSALILLYYSLIFPDINFCIPARGTNTKRVFKLQKNVKIVSSPLTSKDSILWRAYVTERVVSSHSYHHPHEVLLAQFSRYVAKNPSHFFFIGTVYQVSENMRSCGGVCDVLCQCWFNVGPPSSTLVQHLTSILHTW